MENKDVVIKEGSFDADYPLRELIVKGSIGSINIPSGSAAGCVVVRDESRVREIKVRSPQVGEIVIKNDSELDSIKIFGESGINYIVARDNSKIKEMKIRNSKVGRLFVFGDSQADSIKILGNSEVGEIKMLYEKTKVGTLSVDSSATINGFEIYGKLERFEGDWFNYNGKLGDLVLNKENAAERQTYNIAEANDILHGLGKSANLKKNDEKV